MAEILKPAATLMLAAALALAAAAGLEELWRETTAKNRAAYEQKLLSETLSGVRYDRLAAVPQNTLPAPPPLILAVWRAEQNGRAAALAVRAQTRGYGGMIVFIAAFGENGKRLQTRIVRHRETPGIADFLSAPDGGEKAIDGVSGATITSTAVSAAVQQIGAWLRYNRHDLLGK